MDDPEGTRLLINRMLKQIAAQVRQNIRKTTLQKRHAILNAAGEMRYLARIFSELNEQRVPPFEFEVQQTLKAMRGVRRVGTPVGAGGAIRYRSDDGEFNFTPLDGPSVSGSNRQALNEWHASLIGREMFGIADNPYVPALPYYLENGRRGVIQFRTGKQIASPPSRRDSYPLAAVEFVTNNVRDALSGRPFKGLHGIRTDSIGGLRATDNWRTFDWNQPIAANPVVARHSGHLLDWLTHYQIGQMDPAALGDQLLRAGMDKMDVVEVLERIAKLHEFGGIPARHLLDSGP